jgi:hypothetical protein
MPSNGNIVVDGVYSTYLYDMNLNQILKDNNGDDINSYGDDNRIREGRSIQLSTGTYIIKVNYGNSIDEITLSSSILN